MLNREQFLLCKLAEEAAEVGQRAMKMQQYGAKEVQPGQPFNNARRLRDELMDLYAVVEMMCEHGSLHPLGAAEVADHTEEKRAKIAKYLDLSVSLGQVKP